MKMLKLCFFALATLCTLSFTASATQSIQHPLDQIEIPLLVNKNILARHDSKVILLRCATNIDDTNPQQVTLSKCPVYQVVQQLTGKGGVKSETILGKFAKIYFPDFLAHLGASYDPSYKVGPLVIATMYGFVGGGFHGGLAGAIAGGVAGLIVDLAKLPIALLYTLGSYSHRKIQLQRLFVRLNNLQFDRPYRPTRIVSRKQYMQMVNALIEYLDQFHLTGDVSADV